MFTDKANLIELAFELSPTGILAIDRDGKILLVNGEVEALFGYSRDELVGSPVEILIPKRAREKHPEFRSHFFANPSSRPMGKGMNLSGERKDGTEIPVEVGLNPVDVGGTLLTLATVVDITEREQAEERFRIAVESAPSGMLMTNSEGQILLTNKEIEKLFGYSADELKTKTIEDLIPNRFRDQHPKLRAGFFTHPEARAMGSGRDLYGVRSDGKEVALEIGLNPIHSPSGLCVLVSVVDISARKAAERQVRQSQKMEAVGTLAGGIAHDFNNILLNILGHAELAQFNLQTASSEYQDLDQIITAAKRGKGLVERILAFSRHDSIDTGPVDCIKVVQEVMKLIRATTPSSIALNEIYDDNVPCITSNDTQLHQIILNLTTNAVHAMPDGGTLEVCLTPHIIDGDLDSTKWDADAGLPPGLYTRLTISDTGIGMDPDSLDRIFEPFYTTKAPGEGSGLGLSIVHGIVESMDGKIRVKSGKQEGSKFEILFPAAAGEDTEFRESSEKSGSLHVLAVDDEKPIALMLGRQLNQLGFSVSTFHSSLEALAAYKKDPQKYDLLITDNTMPKMTGVELVKNIKSITPQLPVIFLSGHLTQSRIIELQEMPMTKAMPKPYTFHELANALSALLES